MKKKEEKKKKEQMSGDGSSGPLNPHPYHIRSSNGSLMSYAVNWVNSQTATFCQDYET